MQDLQKIADMEEKQAVQKLPATGSNDPISLSIFGIGLVSFVTMLGLTLRRALQPATIPTNSGGLGLDMPMMEMKSQDSHKMSSSRVGWGQLSSQNTRESTLCYASDYALESQALETQEDLKSLAKSLNPAVGYYDPLNIGEDDWSLWNYNNERKIAWFRQAEIKHGRVAMAAFVGYCVQANGGHWFTKMTLGGADWPTGTPPEQWDALPEASKWQIILFVGVLEAFDESIPPHYTNGRKPGEFPSFSETYKAGKGIPHPVPFDLYDPFGFSKNASPEKKARGLRIEINNGRLAMLAVFGEFCGAKVPGAVPPLTGLIPEYSGNYMVPFEGDFSIFFVSPEKPQSARPQTLCDAGKEEMAALAEANPDFLGKMIGLWDPLGALDTNFWGLGNEQTIGYLRHAEIKHGRVAMAAFLGYIVQSTPLVSGTHAVLPFRGYEAGLTPPEQWDATPLYGKLQILVLVGMLESYGEGAGNPDGYVHYTKGGLPGYFPPIAGRAGFGQVTLNLYDPLGWFNEDKDKVRGRQVEINNGRLAMLGIFSLLSEAKVPGAVPPLAGLIPAYSGNCMVPFEGDFSLGSLCHRR